MHLIEAGNIGIRRELVKAFDVEDVSSSLPVFSSTPIATRYCSSGLLTLYWDGFNGLDTIANVWGSNNGTSWNLFDGSAITMDTVSDTQMWQFTKIFVKYVQLRLTFATTTVGTFGFDFSGEFNDAKNY